MCQEVETEDRERIAVLIGVWTRDYRKSEAKYQSPRV